MREPGEQRKNPRLKLCYPIEVQICEPLRVGGTRGVTANLSARGAYFKTFAWRDFQEGKRVAVKIQVPHPLRTDGELIQLRMRTEGLVRRLDRIVGREALGEDGLDLKGIALEFESPLQFNYYWA